MQLGLWLEIRPADDLARLADRAAAAGFSSLHAHFPVGCDRALAYRLVRACSASGLDIIAISGYANPLRPDDAPMGSTLAQLADLIDRMPILDTHRVVSWSGTFAAGLFDDHPENSTPDGWDTLRRSVDELAPVLEDAEAVLLLEPHFAHVLRGPDEAARFCEELNTPYVGVVLDPPTILPPATWDRQSELIPAAVARLARYIGLVNLEDMCLRDGRPALTSPGQGVLDYTSLLAAVRAIGRAVPLVVKHVTFEQAPAARHFVLVRSREP